MSSHTGETVATVSHLTVESVMARWQERASIWDDDRTDELLVSISNEGLLGNDGRVWDGHHRIVIAWWLGYEAIPVDIVPPSASDGYVN